MRAVAVFVLVAALFPVPCSAADGGASMQRVRATHPVLRRAVLEGEAQSPTFRRRLEEVRRSDLIVHLVPAAPGAAADGVLQFVAASGGARFLRIFIRLDLPLAALVALLGHELTHAAEIAGAPAVQDHDGVRQLYRRIGHASSRAGWHDAFDSTLAIVTGERVLVELRDAARGPVE